MRCLWCHNPESWFSQPTIMRLEERCIGCGACRQDPPGECYSGALKTVGREISVSALMAEIESDRLFFDESGGGVTFSGGEPLMQSGVLLSLLRRCRESGISTAVDTSGYLQDEAVFREVCQATDLLLYDVKHVDSERHRRFTGVDNGVIIRNLRLALETGSAVEIRIPCIPGFNGDDESRHAIDSFLRELKKQYDLQVTYLPYHETGISKYRQMGLEYPLHALRRDT